MPVPAEAGRRGADVRSDCWIGITPSESGGLRLRLTSKVASMYGEAIASQVREGLAFLGVRDAAVDIEDEGALPFVLMARLETAVARAYGTVERAWLPEPVGPSPAPGVPPVPSSRERARRSRLYLPGNEPRFMVNAGLHGPDGVILDLEDSVHPDEKDAARILVRNALRAVDFLDAERMVRINPLPLGLLDLEAVVPAGAQVVLIPKCETARTVQEVEDRIHAIQSKSARSDPVFLMPILETAIGVLRAFEIASASPNVVALTIGLEDYTADIGAARTEEGRESFWARSMVVQAARAAGVVPIDSVYSDVGNEEGLRASVREARALGFEGKGCIHPLQIRPIHEELAPSAEEVDRARRVVAAFEEARAAGRSVVSLGTRMIDPPVVRRAVRIVEQAERAPRRG